MSDATTLEKRKIMRTRARQRIRSEKRKRKRAGKKPLSFGAALSLVRRSEVLLYLSRHEGQRKSWREISDETGVPMGAVREVCSWVKATMAKGVAIKAARRRAEPNWALRVWLKDPKGSIVEDNIGGDFKVSIDRVSDVIDSIGEEPIEADWEDVSVGPFSEALRGPEGAIYLVARGDEVKKVSAWIADRIAEEVKQGSPPREG